MASQLKNEDWPLCSNPGCSNEVDPERIRRAKLTTCLECGSPPARVFLIEVSKSNDVVTSDPRAISPLAQPGWSGVSDKMKRRYMPLEKKE